MLNTTNYSKIMLSIFSSGLAGTIYAVCPEAQVKDSVV